MVTQLAADIRVAENGGAANPGGYPESGAVLLSPAPCLRREGNRANLRHREQWPCYQPAAGVPGIYLRIITQ